MSKFLSRVLTTVVLVCSLLACAGLVGCSTGSTSSSASSSSVAVAQINATVTIDPSAADGETKEIAVSVPEGATVLDALQATDLKVESEDSAYGPFVISIDGLSNGDKGAQSGWTYKVNGESPTVSAGELALNDGDVVVWEFFA